MYVMPNKVLLAILDEDVTGHVEAKKALCVLVRRIQMRAYQKYYKMMDDSKVISPLKVLLIGSSGTGKTHLVNTLKRTIESPIVCVAATDFQPTGAGGGLKPSELRGMIREAAMEYIKTHMHESDYLSYYIDRTIVYVDEIDKISTSFDGSDGNWNKGVQADFLTMFDDKDEFAGVSFIFSGTFDSVMREQKKVNTIGFTNTSNYTVNDVEMLDEKILRCGIIPELLGRINMIVELDKFTKKDFVSIINERILPKKLSDLAAFGVFGAKIKKKEIEAIAENASKSGQGVRYAQREIDKLFIKYEFDADNYEYNSANTFLEGEL